MIRRERGGRTRYLAAALLSLAAGCAPRGPLATVITIDTTTTFQTMGGWEATSQAGQDRPDYALYRDSVITLAGNWLGLNRIRLEIRSGMEHRRDYWRETRAGRLAGDNARCARYETQNDNDDPRVIDWTGFHFSELDRSVEGLVLPLKRAVEARGERLIINVTYVSFFQQCPAGRRYDHTNAEEYAEFALAIVLHLRERYGLVPDLWEVILEPDNTGFWKGEQIGRAIVATAARFRERGLSIGFVGPSNTSTARAVVDYDAMLAVPGVRHLLAEFAYHRYRGVSRDVLEAIAARGGRDSIRTAMLEHIGSGIDDLLDDLTIAGVSSWQQYALAHKKDVDDGGLYFLIDDRDAPHPAVRIGSRTRLLRQVFHYVRSGAVRVGAVSDRRRVRTVAFRNADGTRVVVARGRGAARLEVRGLPAGTYGATWTTSDSSGTQADVTITAGVPVAAMLPGAGVLTVFSR